MDQQVADGNNNLEAGRKAGNANKVGIHKLEVRIMVKRKMGNTINI